MEKNFVDFDYLAERLYAIIRDGEHQYQLEAIRILLTMHAGHYTPLFTPLDEGVAVTEFGVATDTVSAEVLPAKAQRKRIDDKL